MSYFASPSSLVVMELGTRAGFEFKDGHEVLKFL